MGALNQILSSYGPSGNGLLTNLVSYWKLDEASGNALDAHGSNTLTQAGTSGTVTGKINGGREISNTKYFSRTDDATLSITGNLGISVWVNPDATSDRYFVSKYATAGNQRSYLLCRESNVVRFVVSSNGTATTLVDTTANITSSVWSHILAWYDSTNINVQVNGGTVFSTAFSAGIFDSTSPFTLGVIGNFTLGANLHLDEIGIWSRSFSAADRTALYNAGAGLAYSSFS